jgi:hypothetical protein
MAAGQMMSLLMSLAIAEVLRYPATVSAGPCFPSAGNAPRSGLSTSAVNSTVY